MAKSRRVDQTVIRCSFSLKEENSVWLRDEAEVRDISVSAFLDAILDVIRKRGN